jgi:hypothetical protein
MNTNEMHTYMLAVASYMLGWKYQESQTNSEAYGRLTHSSGACLCVFRDSYRKRYSFSPDRPYKLSTGEQYYWGREENPHAHVAFGRDAAKVAKEVLRKLESAAFATHAELVKAEAASKAARAGVQRSAGMLATEMRIATDRDGSEASGTFGAGYHSVKVRYSGSVNLELRSIPPELALQIVTLVKAAETEAASE